MPILRDDPSPTPAPRSLPPLERTRADVEQGHLPTTRPTWIAEHVAAIPSITAGIAEAAQRQSHEIGQVDQSVDAVRAIAPQSVAQQSAAAEEEEAAANQLAARSVELREMVARCQLEEHASEPDVRGTAGLPRSLSSARSAAPRRRRAPVG
ncbi:MAG: hypothetical protein IPJ78_01990 [Gemmatimonadetes bacterium]|nr:hypothetical protein [Gemmatimonadota bacterium]